MGWAAAALLLLAGAAPGRAEGSGEGLRATYYDLVNLQSPRIAPVHRIDARIDFDWKTGAPDSTMEPDTWSARWLGQVQAVESGTYMFTAVGDDGVQLWIDGRPVLKRWANGPGEVSGTITLQAGKKYDLEMMYYDNEGAAGLRLFWTRPGQQGRQIIPQAQLYSLPALSYTTSWTGNSFSGVEKWVQNFIQGAFVAPDGTVYTNSNWDEAGRQAGVYKSGDAVGRLDKPRGSEAAHGVTADATHVWASHSKGAVRRFTRRDNARAGDDLVVSAAPVSGLAIANGALYVSDLAANKIKVYDSGSHAFLREWAVEQPGAITIDRKGDLWVLSKGRTTIVRYSPAGARLPGEITGFPGWKPTCLALDNQNRLLVGDDGPRHQIHFYEVSGAATPRYVGSFGTLGGIGADPPGVVTPTKFWGITGCGTDAEGNLYVAQSQEGTVLRKLRPSGALVWQIFGLHFIDNVDFDSASDGRDVFGKEEHFVRNDAQPAGRDWTLKGYTLDADKYPQDPRLFNAHFNVASPFVRRLNNKRYLYITGMTSAELVVYRFDGETAVPAGMFARGTVDGAWPPHEPAAGPWIWRDNDGQGDFDANEYLQPPYDPLSGWGWCVDARGDIWQTTGSGTVGVRRYPLQGFDAHNNPQYDWGHAQQFSVTGFSELKRAEYDALADVMYLSGYSPANPVQFPASKSIGNVVMRIDDWNKGNRTPRWRRVISYEDAPNGSGGLHHQPNSLAVAGDYLFIAWANRPHGDTRVFHAATVAIGFFPAPWCRRTSA